MSTSTISQNLHINGALSAKEFSAPAGSIGDTGIETPSASAGIQVTKLEHRYQPVHADESGATVATEAHVLHVARAVGTIEGFGAGNVVAPLLGATVTVDLLVNGSSVLTATFVIDSSNLAYSFETGTITTPALAAGDIVEASWVAAAGGGTLPTGFYVQAKIKERAA